MCSLIETIFKDIYKNKLIGFNSYTVSSKKPLKLRSLIKELNYILNKNIKVKIGAKKYRKNEAMKSIKKINNYPGWKPKFKLLKELKKKFLMRNKDSKDFENTTAVILCGGRGTRLGVLGNKVPKTLVRVNNKEILWYILYNLKIHGFKNIILPLGYKGSLIRRFLKKNKNFGLNIKMINTGVKTNIGKRIFLIRNEIKSQNFLLLNGDAIFRFDLKNIFRNHCKKYLGATFICGEFTYAYGSIGVKNSKIIDFKRNLVLKV